jgi:hypothetical protein
MPAEFLAGLDPGERAVRYTFEGAAEAPTTCSRSTAGREPSGSPGS